MVQKQRNLLLLLLLLIILVICFILWRADNEIDQVHQQMPDLGSVLVIFFASRIARQSPKTH